MKKLFSLLLAFVMVFSLAACSQGPSTSKSGSNTAGNSGTSTSAEVPTIKFSTFTAYETIQGEGEKQVEQAINDYLDAKGYKFHIDIEVVNGADYITLVDMNLASGTDLDVFLDLTYTSHAGQGSLLNLDPYLENELADAAALFDAQWLDATQVSGTHYAIPAHTTSSSTMYYICRADLIEEMGYDISKVTDLYSLEDFFAAIKEAYPDMWCTDAASAGTFVLMAAEKGNEWGYFSNLYAVGMNVNNKGTMENIYASDTFKQACEMATRWYKNGYLNPAGSTDTTYSPDYITSGQAFGWIVGNANDAETQAANYSNISGQPLVAIPLCEVPDSTAGFYWCISQSTKYPSEAAQLLNLTYTDEFILNAICFGLEGDDYVWKDEINAYGYPEGQDRTTVPYTYAVGITVVGDRLKAYAFENYYSESDRAYIQNKIDNNSRTPLFGMNLDTSNILTQISAVTNVVNQYYNGLMYGELDADTYLPQFLAALEAAGVNDVVAEAQAQYDAWIAANQ